MAQFGSYPQEAVGFDNALLSNDFVPTPGSDYGHACGVYNSSGQWVQKFAGRGSFAEVFDPQFTDAYIAFLAEIRNRLHALPNPKLFVVNTNPIIVSNDATRRARLIASVDAVLVEGGAYGPEWLGDSRKLWLNNLKLSQEMDAAGKGVYGEMRGAGTGEAAIDHTWIQFNLASYLLGKGHHNGLRVRPVTEISTDTGIYWPTEFELAKNIGTPCGLMTQVTGNAGSENALYIREYTNGAAAVNASLTTAYSTTLPSGSYTNLYGFGINPNVTLQPSTGFVYLKTSGFGCGGSTPPPPPVGDTTSPVFLSLSLTNVTASTATASWTTNEPADGQVEFASPCPSTGCTTPLDSALTTGHTVNFTGLLASTTYTLRVRAKDASGNLAIGPYGSFTTTTASSGGGGGGGGSVSGASLWPANPTPANTSFADARAIEVGVKFKSDVDGSISAIRFYKGSLNTGVHTVSLWTTGGSLLARSGLDG